MKFFNLFKKKYKIDNDTWHIYTSHDEEGNPMFTGFDPTYLEEKDRPDFKSEFVVLVVIPEEHLQDGNLIPTGHDVLYKLEDGLMKHIEGYNIDCKVVARDTYKGIRSFVFEVNNEQLFEQSIQTFISKNSNFKIEVSSNEPWKLYTEFLPDEYGWQEINNQLVLAQLKQHGSNPEKEHFIEHALVGDPIKLEELKVKLIVEGYEIIHHNDDWLEVGIRSLPDLYEITGQSYFLMEIAKEHGVEYDGWQTAIIN